jgi:hypothetical protein
MLIFLAIYKKLLFLIMMTHNAFLVKDAHAWVKRQQGPDEVISIRLDERCKDAVVVFQLYTAYETNPGYLGRILFDEQKYWIYDGETLTVDEQEQVAKFILNYKEVL